MTRKSETLPPDVLDALEKLERAQDPTALGPAYQTVLDWRRKAPLVPRGRALFEVVAFVVFLAFLVVNQKNFDLLDEFWRGVTVGAFAVVLIERVNDWFMRRTEPTARNRVDEALDRWRHLTPAMRDIPK